MSVLNGNQYETALEGNNNECSLIFEHDDAYKFMIVENKNLNTEGPKELMRKIKLSDVSAISTDLEQRTQFDFAYSQNLQLPYSIRLYGPIAQ